MCLLKNSEVIQVDVFITTCIFMTILAIFLYRWQKSVYEVERQKQELKITNMYNGMFEELIDVIRYRQHDFHNQIDAIYSTHLVANTMEELVSLQSQYCSKIIYENRFTKILSKTKNSVLAGFLYSKFTKAEKKGIEIKYDISYREVTDFSTFDLIEIVGILMDNAIEAAEECEEKIVNAVDAIEAENIQKLIIFELKDNDGLSLYVRNPVKNISYQDIEKFFEKGFTTKEEGNGLGLSKIKEYQKKYDYKIFTQIIDEDMIQWIEFKIIY